MKGNVLFCFWGMLLLLIPEICSGTVWSETYLWETSWSGSYSYWAYGEQSGGKNGDVIHITGGENTLSNMNIRVLTQAEIDASSNPGNRQPGPIHLQISGGQTIATDNVQINDTATFVIQGRTSYQENLFGTNNSLYVGNTAGSRSSMSISNAKVILNQDTEASDGIGGQCLAISVLDSSEGTITIGEGGWLDTTVGQANYIAHDGKGTMNILSGGKFTSRTGGFMLASQKWGTQIAFRTDSEGTLNVAGGEFDVEHFVTVGSLGKGGLHVTQGGTAKMPDLYIGGRTTTALGAGSGEGYVTIGGKETLDSGTLSARNAIYVAYAISGTDTPRGTLEVIQGTVTTNDLWLSVNSRSNMPTEADARVILHDGGTIHAQSRLDVAVQGNTFGEVEINGGKLIVGNETSSGYLNVGSNDGFGKIVIRDGGVLDTRVGFDWGIGSGNSIGHNGTGVIVVEEGGTFQTEITTNGMWGATTLGGWGNHSGTGTGTLSIEGGTFLSRGVTNYGNTLHVGTIGTGILHIGGKANVDVQGRVYVTDIAGSEGMIHATGSQAEIRLDSLAMASERATLRFSGDSGGFSTIWVENRSTATDNNKLNNRIEIHDATKIEVESGAAIAVYSQPSYTLIDTQQGIHNIRIADPTKNWGVATSEDGLKLVATPQNGVDLRMNQHYSFEEPLEKGWFEVQGSMGENWALRIDMSGPVEEELLPWLESIEWGDSLSASVFNGSQVLLSGLQMNSLGTAYLSWDLEGTGMSVQGLYAQSVPEPASWVLFFMGLFGLLWWQKEKKNAKS